MKDRYLFWVIAERSHVLIHLNIWNDLSGVTDVASFVKTITVIITATFLINYCKDWMTGSSSSSTIREFGL